MTKSARQRDRQGVLNGHDKSPASAPAKMFESFKFEQLNRSGLFIPGRTLNQLLDEAEHLDKAQGSGKAWQRKAGQLFNLYHCFPGHARIQTRTGIMRMFDICKAIDAGQKVEIKSWDGERVVWAPISRWGKRPNPDGLWRVQWGRGGRRAQSTSSPNHPILTRRGWVQAGLVEVGDDVAVIGKTLSEDQEQIVLGTLLGDGSMRSLQGGSGRSHWPSLHVGHSVKQSEYLAWMADALGAEVKLGGVLKVRPCIRGREIRGQRLDRFVTPASPALWRCWELAYGSGKKRVTKAWLDRLGPLALAVWFMDDGCAVRRLQRSASVTINFATAGFDEVEVELLRAWLRRRFKLRTVAIRHGDGRQSIGMRVGESKKFIEIVKEWVAIGQFGKKWLSSPIVRGAEGITWLPVVSSAVHPHYRGQVYDIQVDPTHCFVMSSGLVVHNSIWSNLTQWGAAEKPRATPTHRFLREVAKQSMIDRLIINARQFQMRHVSKRVMVKNKQKGWNVLPKHYSDPDVPFTKDIKRRCLEMEEFLLRPNPEVHPTGIKDFLVKAMQGELIIDRKVMVMQKGNDARPRNFHLLPPDEIKPRFEVLLSFMSKMGTTNPDQAMDEIFKQFGVDVSSAAFIQHLDDGRVTGAWSADEISVDITSPSDELNRFGFGVSCLENSLEVTNMLMMALNYNKQGFTAAYPEAFLFFQGDVDQEGLEAFKRQIYAEVGPFGNIRLPMLSTGGSGPNVGKAQLLKLRDSLRDMQFPLLIRMFIALKCAAYRAHPSLVNFAPDAGGQRPIINNETQEEQIALAQEEGLHSLLGNMADWLTRNLIEPWYDDLELVWTVQDQPTDMERIQLGMQRSQLGETVEEWRATEGLPPLEKITNGAVDGKYINSTFFFQKQQQQLNEQMMLAQAAGELPQEGEEGEGGGMPMMAGGMPGMMPGRGGNGNGNGNGKGARKSESEPIRKSLKITITQTPISHRRRFRR